MPKASFTEEASASTETIDNASNTRSNTSSVAETIGTLLYLDPSDVCQDPLTDIRGPETDDKAEDEAITRLAHTMKNGMQIQPITVRPVFDSRGRFGKYKIVAGRRRTLAAAIAKMQVAAYVVELTDDEAYRAAIVENIQRKTLSPVSFARHIKKIREREGWQGADGTKQVSRYFGVSPAEITTHEKILMLDKKIIKQGVQEGWAAQTFFAVVKAQEKAGAAVVPEILEAAQKEADQEEAAKPKAASAKKSGVSAKSATPATPAKIQKKHVAKAAEKSAGVQVDAVRNRRAILNLFCELMDEKMYGKGPHTAFARYLVGTWAPGVTQSDMHIKRLWQQTAAELGFTEPA